MLTMHEAAANGDIEALTQLIEEAEDNNNLYLLNALDSQGMTPLQHAAKNGKVEALKLLIDCGARVDHKTNNKTLKLQQTALHYAVQANQAEAVKALLEKNANANVQNSTFMTPLHYAAQQGSVELIDILIKHGANSNCTTPFKTTPAHLIAESGNLDAIRKISEWKMDATIKTNDGLQLIHYAFFSGKIEAVKEFIKRGINLSDITYPVDEKILYLIFGGEKLSSILPDQEKLEGYIGERSAKIFLYYLIRYFITHNIDDKIANNILKQFTSIAKSSEEKWVTQVKNGESLMLYTGHTNHFIAARLQKNEMGEISLYLYDKGQYCGEEDPKNSDKYFCIREINFKNDPSLIKEVIDLLLQARSCKETESEKILFIQIPALIGSKYQFSDHLTQKPFKVGKCAIGNYSLFLCDLFIKNFASIQKGKNIYKDFSIDLRESVANDFQKHDQYTRQDLKDALKALTQEIVDEKRKKIADSGPVVEMKNKSISQ